MTADELLAQNRLELERMTFTMGGGKLRDGVSAGAVMLQSFLNEQIDLANKEAKDSPLKGRKHLTVDGDNGDRTKAMVKLYQEQHHLHPQDGVVGLDTYAQMKKDGFNIDAAIAAKSAYLETPAGKKYAEAVNAAITTQEFAYVVGDSSKDAGIDVQQKEGKLQNRFAIAAIQLEMKKAYPDGIEIDGKKVEVVIDGKWEEKDKAILAKWAADDSKHFSEEKGKTGVFNKSAYDALPWNDATQSGYDSTRFKEKLHKGGVELAKALGIEEPEKDTSAKIEKLLGQKPEELVKQIEGLEANDRMVKAGLQFRQPKEPFQSAFNTTPKALDVAKGTQQLG